MEPKICVWADLTSENLDVIFSASTNENLMSVISDVCKLKGVPDMKSQILLEFYFSTIQFAKSLGMNYAQTSALFSIMKLVHTKCTSTPYNNNEDTFSYFKQLLIKHSLQRPPYSVGVFTVNQVQAITDYALNTYFRHFDMYKYAFTPKVRVDISFHYDGVPMTPEPEPVPEPEQTVPEEEGDKTEAEDGSEAAPEEPQESEEVKQIRELIQVAMGSELKQLQARLEKMISEQDIKISQQVEALEESMGLKSGSKSPGSKKKK